MNHRVIYCTEGLRLHPDVLKAVLLWASLDDTRRHLCGVFVDDCHLTATNGHGMIRVLSVDPTGGGYGPPADAPKDYHGSFWSTATVEQVIAAHARTRGRAREHVLALLPWNARTDLGNLKPPPCTRFFDELAPAAKYKPGPKAIATRYVVKLGETAELLLGKDALHKGPVLLNETGPESLWLYGIPWRDDAPADEGTWAQAGRTGKPAPRGAHPEYGAEIVLSPLRVS